MIMKAYGFQHLVDQFGDVPYSQAFQPSTILFPAYDKGIDVYHDLGKQLDAAIALIKASAANTMLANPGSSDIVFGGNMTGWKKFANSIKLRMAIRVSAVTGFDAHAIMATTAAAADAVDASGSSANFLGTETSAVANPGYANIVGKQNPFYGSFGADASGNPAPNNVYYRANAFAVNMMNNFNDPRAIAILF